MATEAAAEAAVKRAPGYGYKLPPVAGLVGNKDAGDIKLGLC